MVICCLIYKYYALISKKHENELKRSSILDRNLAELYSVRQNDLNTIENQKEFLKIFQEIKRKYLKMGYPTEQAPGYKTNQKNLSVQLNFI